MSLSVTTTDFQVASPHADVPALLIDDTVVRSCFLLVACALGLWFAGFCCGWLGRGQRVPTAAEAVAPLGPTADEPINHVIYPVPLVRRSAPKA